MTFVTSFSHVDGHYTERNSQTDLYLVNLPSKKLVVSFCVVTSLMVPNIEFQEYSLTPARRTSSSNQWYRKWD